MTESREMLLQKTKEQRKRVLTFLLLSITALVVCMLAVVCISLSLITEGTEPSQETPAVVNTVCPSSKKETLSYIKKITSFANDNRTVFVNSSVAVSIPDDRIEFSGNDAKKNVLNYMKSSIQSSLDEFYPEDKNGEFGDGFTDFPQIFLPENKITSFKCEAGYLNEKNERVNADRYYAELTMKPENYSLNEGDVYYKTFRMYEYSGIIEKLKDAYSSLLTVDSFEIVPDDYKIKTTSWCADDKIIDLTLSRTYRITLSYTFKGEYASLGSESLSFDYTVDEKFSYIWVSVKFNTDVVSVKEGESQKLDVTATINDYSDYEIRFESSDNNIATLDELGYVRGLKTCKKEITVTVHLNYLGFEYSDMCTVYVRNPVEKIKISENKKTLRVNETFTLTSFVKPDNATVKDVFYKSSDETVATVSEGGTVTALSEGEVLISAISVDGRFKDSCKLTVAGKGAK